MNRIVLLSETLADNPPDYYALMDRLEAKYPVTLWVTIDRPKNALIVSSIIVDKDKRNKGIGTSVMQELLEYADEHGLNVYLTPSTEFGSSKARLQKFYRNMGFKPYNDYQFRHTMVRTPI